MTNISRLSVRRQPSSGQLDAPRRRTGLAWHRCESRRALYVVLPFNWLARALRDVYYWIARPRFASRIERFENEAYSRILKDLRSDYDRRVFEMALSLANKHLADCGYKERLEYSDGL